MSFEISTKGRYGLRAMIELALHYGENPLPLQKIAQRQGVSFKYLEQLIPSLKGADLVRSVRGSSGGYLLAKPPHKIYLIEILTALEGDLAPAECVDHPRVCSKSDECVIREIWSEVDEAIKRVFGSKTLHDLVSLQQSRETRSDSESSLLEFDGE